MPSTSLPRARRRLSFLTVLALVATTAGCGVSLSESAFLGGTDPTNNGDILGTNVGTSTSTSPSTTTTLPAPTDVDIVGDDGSAANVTIANAIADLQAWWDDEFPAVYDDEYEPVSGGFYAIDRDTDASTIPCLGNDIEPAIDNAFYCFDEDVVVWDQESLMPDLVRDYGAFTPAVAIAHEWGHAIQARSEFRGQTVTGEQQADCFAGAWVRHIRDDEDARFRVTIDDLDRALSGMLSLRDAPGSSADDPNAHGSGFDRVRAFQEGFERGSERCSEYRDGSPEPFQFPFTSQEDLANEGNLPLEGEGGILDSVFPSLDAYWKGEFPNLSDGDEWNPLGEPIAFSPDDPPTCNGKEVTGFAFFVCAPDRFIGYDAVDFIPAVYEEGGDFAVATLFATQYGLDVQQQLGSTPDSEVRATLIADCYAGSWSAAILPGVEQPTDDGIQLSPGDLDEAVSVLLRARSDADRSRQGPGFDRVRAFGVGVTDGAEACADVRPS